MNKDVIYIDTEDDITAIIGKIKDSKERIVALVPPKRIGILQSAVNLKLLARMADSDNKRLVLVTNNKALINLSSVAQIPVAKNLQSKPEMAEIDALEIDDGEDVIEGKQLPVGELVKTTDPNKKKNSEDVEDVIDTIDVEKNIDNPEIEPKEIEKSKVKVPDFSRFRKKLFIGIILVIGLAVFLVWANVFAPAATVIITAKTSPTPISLSVKLGGTAATDVSKGIIQTVTKQTQKNLSVNFTPTGQQNVGNKASGTVTVENCNYTKSFTISANTTFAASSGQTYTNDKAVVVPGFSGSDFGSCLSDGTGAGTVDVTVTAVNPGEDSNISATNYTISGVGSYVYANGEAMTGGTDKVAAVVTAQDVQTAEQALVALTNDDIKQQLIKEFINGESVISDSFNTSYATPVSAPIIGAEADNGKATLTSQTTFSITAIAKSEIEPYLKDAINKQINGNNQRIYNDGISTIKLSGYSSSDQGTTVNIAATGQVGPNINDASIKQQIKGKQFGDAQSLLNGINGVNNVDIKFSYFWVTTIPTDVNKIDVQFILQNA
jgi:hypothetical protein